MMLPPGLSLSVEDKPAEADVEVLPYGLEAYNEQHWPGHQPWQPLGVFLREGARVVAGLAGGELRRLALHPLSLDRRAAAPPGNRQPADPRGRAAGAGARLPLGHGRYLQLPGAGFLPEAGLRRLGRLDYPPKGERIFLRKRLA
nr:hypothetical protein [Siccirubricoccus sp. G192]